VIYEIQVTRFQRGAAAVDCGSLLPLSGRSLLREARSKRK